MSPILSAGSIREMPELQARRNRPVAPKSMASMMRTSPFHELSESIVDEAPLVNPFEALYACDVVHRVVLTTSRRNVRPGLDRQSYKDVALLMSRLPNCARYKERDIMPHEEKFLASDSPACIIMPLDSPPLFPRDRLPGKPSCRESASRVTGTSTFLQLLPVPALDSAHEEEELYQEHMAIVSGWSTLQSSGVSPLCFIRFPQQLSSNRPPQRPPWTADRVKWMSCFYHPLQMPVLCSSSWRKMRN